RHARAGERVQRAERSRRPARALPRAGRPEGARRRRGPLARRGLRAGPGVRHAARGGGGNRHRPADDALRQPAVDSRGDPVPPLAAGGRLGIPPGRAERVKRGLPLELFLGLRYLTARGSRANLSLFVWIGVGGVFLGVAALIVVLAVMTGFQDGIRDRIISANPHLLVFQSGSAGMADPAAVVARVTTLPGVRAATPFVLQQALFTSAGGDAHGGLVRGVDFDSRPVRDDLKAQLRSGRLEAAVGGEGILLGVELARTLGVVPGDAVAIIGHLVLLVAEKRKEIGVLKAIGASASSITAVFFSVGMTIGVVGTVAGSIVGLAIIWIQNTYKIIKLAGDVYQIDYLPMKL